MALEGAVRPVAAAARCLALLTGCGEISRADAALDAERAVQSIGAARDSALDPPAEAQDLHDRLVVAGTRIRSYTAGCDCRNANVSEKAARRRDEFPYRRDTRYRSAVRSTGAGAAMRAWCARTAAILGLVGAFGASSTAIAAPDDGVLGGTPTSNVSSTSCPNGKAATGITGRIFFIGANPIAGTATVQCAGGAVAAGTMGTLSGGNTGSTTCAAGQVAVGISGREGDFVDRLAVRCQAADLTGAITTAAGYGGNGGGADGPYDCGSGKRPVGLDGTLSA